MERIVELPVTEWSTSCPPPVALQACAALEAGCIVFLPDLRFDIAAGERQFLASGIAAGGKNISFDTGRDTLSHVDVDMHAAADLRALMARFATLADGLVSMLLPAYDNGRTPGRTSLRPVEIETRKTSWRQDDTRLHVDSFPSTPVHGRRILRLFSNVNPEGRARTWRVGEPFEAVARRYVRSLSFPLPGSSRVLHALGITKSRRSAYDHLMLGLHDRMKRDTRYQTSADQQRFEFPPGSSWLVFTDQVSHAAMSGQHALEQTFYVDVEAMREPAASPLRVLERLSGRTLVERRDA